MKKLFITFGILLFVANICLAEELLKPQTKYPDYGYMYLGADKYEKLNRKIFAFNLGLNKYAIRPIHILWSSIMPEYGIERIHSAYKNIEYPKRLVSSIIQKDFKTSGTETVRFLTNTTLGIGGIFDPAKYFFKLEPSNEDMEQALTKCKCNSGSYIVLPVMNGTTARGIAGKILDTSLNPTTYVGTPVLAMVKAGLTVNRTSFMQPLIKMIESTYADPYNISRKMYGIDNFIKCENLDKKEVLENGFKLAAPQYPADVNPELVKMDLRGTEPDEKPIDELTVAEIIKGGTNIDNIILKSYNATNSRLMADILLHDYNPQNPVVDSMRTALFDNPNVDKSIWNELSIWNRSFAKKIHTSSINIAPDRPNYKFKYIMQKDKNAPVAIIYPSIGEGISSHHSVVLAKLFYDEGYSVIIQGSHFQWEFARSMPNGYVPGIPSKDVEYLKEVTGKIISNLEKKYACKFPEKTVIGTSFGAMATLYLADSEFKHNTLGKVKFISICPPIELVYAMEQVDKNSEEWSRNTENLKHKIAETAAKVVQLADLKDSSANLEINSLPFSEEEGKLITGFIMHQKLSDLVFTLENTPKNKQTAIYDTINNMNYKDYAVKYLLKNNFANLAELNKETSLLSLEDYLKNNSNYKIYHSLDDYLTNHAQLKKLKLYTGKNTVLMSNGAHLGFLYTKEFLDDLKSEIRLNQHLSTSSILE